MASVTKQGVTSMFVDTTVYHFAFSSDKLWDSLFKWNSKDAVRGICNFLSYTLFALHRRALAYGILGNIFFSAND